MNHPVSRKKTGHGPRARQDFPRWHQTWTVQESLDFVREYGIGGRIVYFYVVDNDGRLAGVVSTHRLPASSLEKRFSAIMIRRVRCLSTEILLGFRP